VPTDALRSDKEAFRTHLNYADCLAALMREAALKPTVALRRAALPHIEGKQNLITLTKRSLEEEKKIVDLDADYSFASTSWLPVKGYYLLFNRMLTIEYIITRQQTAFTMSHAAILKSFSQRLVSGEFVFDRTALNEVFQGGIFSHRDQPGANLSRSVSEERRWKMAMAKIADYKLDEWKRSKKIKDFKTNESRAKRDEFLKRFTLSIFEYPYFMRVRANYRDFAFIEGVSSNDTANYFRTYFDFIMSFDRALEHLQTALKAMRR
jgi:hypothetical protein